VVAMKHHLYTEMIDDTILDCTKIIGNKVRIGFLQGPKAIMMFELASDAMEDTEGRRMR
jgi:hypothetical protein